MAKKAKASRKAAAKDQLPNLVDGMTRLVERLEALERKTDQILGRVGSLPSELHRAIQDLPRPQTSYPQAPRHEPSSQGPAPRERILYQATCSDCLKRCEVPFKPSGERPVYCPECWAIRKAGHKPKDITSGVIIPTHLKTKNAGVTVSVSAKPVPSSAKSKPAKAKKAAPKKKKK